MAVAEMLEVLDSLIPTRTKVFIWLNPKGEVADLYEKYPIPEALDAFISQSPDLAADPDEPSMDKLINSPVDYGGWERLRSLPNWERSIMKNELFRAYGIGNNIDFVLRQRGVPKALFIVAREPGSRAFSRTEVQIILAVRSHFLHAIAQPAEPIDGTDLQGDDCGVAIVSRSGEVIEADAIAWRLLFQMSKSPPMAPRFRPETVPLPVMEVVYRSALARDGFNLAPPGLVVGTRFGPIYVRARWMRSIDQFAVTLQATFSGKVTLLRKVARLDLSPRQRELAVAMCSAEAGEGIAARLRLSDASYREYTRRLYSRLGVDSRLGVVSQLTSGAKT